MRYLATCMSLLVVTCWAQKEEQLAIANNRFGIRLLKILPSSPQENVFFSPSSLATAMGMAFMGARGKTRQELHRELGYASSGFTESDLEEAFALHTRKQQSLVSNSTVDVANAAAVHERLALLSAFETQLTDSFNAELFKVDFELKGQEAVETINQWVKIKTHQKIPTLFGGPLDPSTRLVLLSAIYFKGKWNKEFEKTATQKRTFLNGGTTPTQVDTMTGLIPVRHQSFDSLGFDMAAIPYRGGDYSMVILLPKQNDGVETLKQNLTQPLIRNLVDRLEERDVHIFLPKFKFETEYSLKDHLENLGIRRIFGDGADFSGITSSEHLYVSKVIQKAIVKVDEEGTEAAAVSAVVFGTKSLTRPPYEFRVDHPFIFFIWNVLNRDVLFVGQVNHL